MAELQEYEQSKAKPFLKWAGGKGQLLNVYKKCYPPGFGTYFEPFLGGAAVFFDLHNKNRISKAVLSDSNRDLINCYIAIRDNLRQLFEQLEILQQKVRDEEFFYKKARPKFNSIELRTGEEGNVEKAALLIYLNKTCFNGLYRVNRRGEFNVPWGRYRNPRLADKSNLSEVNRVLNERGIQLRCLDYREIGAGVKDGDFVYLDPPYQPISATASFTNYTAEAFSGDEQEDLSEFFDELDSREALLMLSNSPKVLPYYEGKGYRIIKVKAARAISSVGSKRGPVEEILVTNY
jgi:DNA adenine methylase